MPRPSYVRLAVANAAVEVTEGCCVTVSDSVVVNATGPRQTELADGVWSRHSVGTGAAQLCLILCKVQVVAILTNWLQHTWILKAHFCVTGTRNARTVAW